MTTQSKNILVLMAILGAVALVGCGDAGSTTEEAASGEDTEFANAIPSADMMALEMQEGAASQQQGLAVAQQALADPSGNLRVHTQEVMQAVNRLIQNTHERMDNMVENVEPETIELNNRTCKQWVDDGARATWRMTACRVERQATRFTVLVEGRALDAPEGADFVPAILGESWRLERHEGRRRSRGRMAYNLDNIAQLRGADFGGKLAIGYHAAGPARTLNLGMRDVTADVLPQPINARYSFRHALGRGGSFRYLSHRDFLTTDGAGDLEFGQDGTAELGRAAVAWSTEGAARTAFAICGGTVGQRCVRMHQCWEADGSVTFEEVVDGEPNWEPASCREVFEDIRQPPAEADVDAPEQDTDEIEVAIPEDPTL
jgi:hypothetical protein